MSHGCYVRVMLTSLTLPARLFMMMLIGMMVGGEYHDSFSDSYEDGVEVDADNGTHRRRRSRFSHRER